MAYDALTTFGFIPCSNLLNGYGFSNVTLDGLGSSGFRPWSEVVPPKDDPGWYCPTTPVPSGGVDYKPYQLSMQYTDWANFGSGYPSVQYTWPQLDIMDHALIWQGFDVAYQHCHCQCWFMLRDDMGGGTWRITSGLIDPPQHDPIEGDFVYNFRLTFTRIAFHANVATRGTGKSIFPFEKSFGDFDYRL